MIVFLVRSISQLVLGLRYRLHLTGLEEVASRGSSGILFLPNHPALIDPVIVLTVLQKAFRPRSMADRDRINLPIVRWLAPRLGVRPLPDVAKYGEACKEEVQRVIQESIAGLKAGENLLMYPAGHLARSRHEDLGGTSALSTILEQVPDARIVLVRTRGLWGSSFSWASGKAPHFAQGFFAGIRYVLLNLVFFSPRRDVTLEFSEPGDLPRSEGRAALNRYLETFYNSDTLPHTYVPHTLWEGGETRTMPEPEPPRIEGDLSEVSASTRELVMKELRDLTGITEIHDSATLARDLGMDSLARMEIQLWIEREFGFHGVDPESLQTVSDVLLAATGRAVSASGKALKPIAPVWFQRPTLPIEIPEGEALTEVFLRQAARGAGRPVLADQTSGVKTYRDILTAILVLKPHLESIEGDYVGLMLPASGAASIFYMALLFAGKTPVMVNWTVGARNIAHGLDLLGVKQVLTAGQLVSKVESMGTDLTAIKNRMYLLEDLGRRLGTLEKVSAALKARFGARSLRGVPVRETAVVLFTSGSESLPKAVPLTHANILTNLRDMPKLFPFLPGERMIGILPPFHSFGLTCTSLLPLCSGIQVVYHPNPTEGVALARLIEAYGVSMLVGTPTFLHGITRAARDEQLASLRVVIAGAEKCPDLLYETLERRWPELKIVEGYGITECSPVVAGNRVAAPRRHALGYMLDSVKHVVVDLDSGERLEPGRTGMLLVRGPSVFKGYLNYDGPSPFEEFEGQTWYRTGDLVWEEADGLLFFAGRLKRFVKLGGEMVSLPAVEDALLARFASESDEEIILAVEATPVDTNPELVLFTIRDITREAANLAIRDAGLSPIHNIRLVKRVETIPQLGNGKTDYRTLKGLLGA